MNRSYEFHDHAIDRLREAVRTIPMDSWCLVHAKHVMKDASDYRPMNREGFYSWDFTIKKLDEVVEEGWLTLVDGRYVPTDAARGTWPDRAMSA